MCNQGFSQDEEYLVCLVEAAICGSADPDKIRRPSVSRTMRRCPALQARIETARTESENRIEFAVEGHRIANVMLKLARGHAAFELSQPCRGEPDHFWCGPLAALTDEQRDSFDAAHIQEMFGEVGSRGLQRMLVTQMVLQSEAGKQSELRMLVNDWVDVQDNLYRYLAIDDSVGLVIRIVIAEYLGCEVVWRTLA